MEECSEESREEADFTRSDGSNIEYFVKFLLHVTHYFVEFEQGNIIATNTPCNRMT